MCDHSVVTMCLACKPVCSVAPTPQSTPTAPEPAPQSVMEVVVDESGRSQQVSSSSPSQPTSTVYLQSPGPGQTQPMAVITNQGASSNQQVRIAPTHPLSLSTQSPLSVSLRLLLVGVIQLDIWSLKEPLWSLRILPPAPVNQRPLPLPLELYRCSRSSLLKSSFNNLLPIQSKDLPIRHPIFLLL